MRHHGRKGEVIEVETDRSAVRDAAPALLAATASALILFLALAAPTQAAFPGSNGKIAWSAFIGTHFPSHDEGEWWIVTGNSDGSNITRIHATGGNGDNMAANPAPRWSPNGAKIAFSQNFGDESHPDIDIATINPDGSGLTRVSNVPASAYLEGVLNPKWSPDGTKIAAYKTAGTGYPAVMVFNSDGSGLVGSAANPNVTNDFEWSPDGTKIVLTSGDDIYLMNPFGLNDTTRLTNTTRYESEPSWSPDGSMIVYVGSQNNGALDLYTMNADGTGQSFVAGGESSAADPSPKWFPDGSRIAFVSHRDGNDEIYSVAPVWDGIGATRITNNPARDWNFEFSPDAQKFVFQSNRMDGNCVYDMNRDGTGAQQVSFKDPETQNDIYNIDPFCDHDAPDWQALRPPGYARPKVATPNSIRLVPAFKPCSSPNASHGAPLSVSSCSPPQQSSDYLTVGTPDVNGQAANSVGLLTTKVLTEAPINLTNGDQSDVDFTISITDVRNKQTLADYTGELRASFGLRLTDRLNGAGRVQPATIVDSTFGFSFSCAATGAGVGSTCSASTSADAVVPGSTPEFQRAVWQLGQVQIYDGGSDGDGDTTGGNTLYMTQGLYAP